MRINTRGIRNFLSTHLLEHFPAVSSFLFKTLRNRVILKSYGISVKKRCQHSETLSKSDLAINEKSKILLIVPSKKLSASNWGFAQGVYLHEIWASGKEYLKVEIEIFSFDETAYGKDEFDRLLMELVGGNYSHLLTSLESNPGSTFWDWDYFAARALDIWSGLVIGLSTDSIYRKHQIQFQRFVSIYGKTVIIGIDVVPDTKYLESKNYYGPTLLPISKASIAQIDRYLPNASSRLQSRQYDVVFVGEVYPYREAQLKRILDMRVDLSINPHRSPLDDTEGKGYVDYVAAICSGFLTLNLSRANGVNHAQLKSRVLEGPVFGAPVLSDEKNLSAIFFDPDKEFIYFDGSDESLLRAIEQTKDKDMISNMSKSAKLKARGIAQSAFWNTVIVASKEFNQHG